MNYHINQDLNQLYPIARIRRLNRAGVVRANKLLNQGYEAYLAYFINLNLSESKIDNIQTVCKFPNVFLEEFLGLPLDREVE
ncbi:RVP_2 domain-containing protein [Gossypium australe]|uniref:RVP_2 domain-containing protein n=1 Tax=Gossypium australe TaxID=47621 RepID=A0A5B6WSH0_9ROSI|nr:RVP_2 domain-containing protein [Gossypium australe]